MPGVAGPGPEGPGATLALELEERLTQALQQLRQEVEGGQQAAAQAAEAAMAAVEPVAQAARELQKETAALRGQLEALSLQLEALSLRLGLPNPSTLFLASEDPEALFQGVEDEEGPEATPVAHPPAFSTRRLSSAPLSHVNSLVSWDKAGRREVGGPWGGEGQQSSSRG